MPGRERNVERLVFFSDAVVAIAITLLALPLAEVPVREESGTAVNALPAQLGLDFFPFVGAALSFFVAGRLWWAHHQLFAHVQRFTMPMVVTNFVWLFTVVLLSPATALVVHYSPGDDPEVILVYTAALTLSGLALTALVVTVHLAGSAVTTETRAQTRDRVIGAAFTAGTFAVAGALGFALPVVGYWALLLLFPSGLVESLVKHRLAGRAARRG